MKLSETQGPEVAAGSGDETPADQVGADHLIEDEIAGSPAETAEWFRKAEGAWSPASFGSHAPFYHWVGDFNVEVAKAALATRYFEECLERCYLKDGVGSCPTCSRTATRFVSAASGTGDGAYPVVRLLDPQLRTVGIVTGFMGSLDGVGLVGRTTDFADVFATSAPMLLGTLDCQGTLLAYDASKALDDPEVAVDVAVPPGSYAVICWVREPEFGADRGLLPVALAAVTGGLEREAVHRVPLLDERDRRRLVTLMWGREDRLVDALMADVRPPTLMKNIQMSAGHDGAAAHAWAAQFAELYEADPVLNNLLDRMVAGGDTDMLEMLEWRGILEPRLAWWTPPTGSQPGGVWHHVLEARDPSKPLSLETLDSSRWARRSAARRADLDASQASRLAVDPDPRVRLNLATNLATTPDCLAALAVDADPAVRAVAQDNPACPAPAQQGPELAEPAPVPTMSVRRNSEDYRMTLLRLGGQLVKADDLELAEAWLRGAMDGAAASGDAENTAAAANSLAMWILGPQERRAEARRVLKQAVDQGVGHQSDWATCYLGIIEYGEGNLAVAEELFQRVLDRLGPVGHAHYHLGLIARDNGDLASARHHFQLAADSDDAEYAAKAKTELKPSKRRWWRRTNE